MQITFSLFFLFSVTVVALLFVKRMRVPTFLVSAIWGFLLAQTTAAPSVRNFLSEVARLFGAR